MKTQVQISDVPRYCGDEGETISLSDTLQIRVATSHDDCHSAPWKECDCYGIVSEWTSRDKYSGERLLHSDRNSKMYYDFAATMAKAKKEGWGIGIEEKKKFIAKNGRAPTKGEAAVMAVEADFELLRGWCNNEWSYIVLSVSLESIDEDGEATEIEIDHLGGVESSGDYWREQAAEMADTLIKNYLTEQAEKAEWEARDVVTV